MALAKASATARSHPIQSVIPGRPSKTLITQFMGSSTAAHHLILQIWGLLSRDNATDTIARYSTILSASETPFHIRSSQLDGHMAFQATLRGHSKSTCTPLLLCVAITRFPLILRNVSRETFRRIRGSSA